MSPDLCHRNKLRSSFGILVGPGSMIRLELECVIFSVGA